VAAKNAAAIVNRCFFIVLKFKYLINDCLKLI
jgi:hypothetical protein